MTRFRPFKACWTMFFSATLIVFFSCILIIYLFTVEKAEEHLQRFCAVLDRVKKQNLYTSPKKCESLKTETAFLSLIVGREGLVSIPRRPPSLKIGRLRSSSQNSAVSLTLCNSFVVSFQPFLLVRSLWRAHRRKVPASKTGMPPLLLPFTIWNQL